MGRKRKIPLESKTIKYMYFIKVDLKGEDVLKFGISNNVVRRINCPKILPSRLHPI